MRQKKAIIAGMGAVCAAGGDIDQIFDNFSLGKREVNQPSLFSSDLGYPVFEVKDIPKEFFKKKRRTLSLLLWALHQAWQGINLEGLRVGTCFGTTVASQLNDLDFYKTYRENKKPKMDAVERYLKNNISQNISEIFNFGGPVSTIVNACSSGADSIGVALEWLRSDICDVVVCGGADELSPIPYYGFGALGVVSTKACRPFDCNRDGLNLGEGAGVLILVKEEIKKQKKIKSNLFISGYGSAADSYHLTTPHPKARGLKNALTIALKDANAAKNNICFINAHGTATKENDKIEGLALKDVFGKQIKFFSSKGFTGHTLGAAGALEVIFTAWGLNKGWIPESIGFNCQDPEIGIKPVTDKTNIAGSHAISTSLAFGGNNTAIVVEKQ